MADVQPRGGGYENDGSGCEEIFELSCRAGCGWRGLGFFRGGRLFGVAADGHGRFDLRWGVLFGGWNGRRGFFHGGVDRRNKPVATLGDGLNETRIVGVIAKGLAKFGNGGAKALIEFYEGATGPEKLAQRLACNDFTRMLE